MSYGVVSALALFLALAAEDAQEVSIDVAVSDFQTAVAQKDVRKLQALTDNDISFIGRPIDASDAIDMLKTCSGEDPKTFNGQGSLIYRCDPSPAMTGKCKSPAYGVSMVPVGTHVRARLFEISRTDGTCVAPRGQVIVPTVEGVHNG